MKRTFELHREADVGVESKYVGLKSATKIPSKFRRMLSTGEGVREQAVSILEVNTFIFTC